MFVSVFVVMMGFRRSVRMGSGVHAKKNLPHQLLKDKGRLQSDKIIPSSVLPSESRGIPPHHLEDCGSRRLYSYHQCLATGSLHCTRDDGRSRTRDLAM